jgi:hypothetical protein
MFCLLEGRQSCRRVCRNHETSLYRLQPSLFFGGQKTGSGSSGLCDHLKHRFIVLTKVEFSDIQKADNKFTGPFAHRNIASSTLSKLHFWMPRRQKMSSHGLSTPWNVYLSTTRKSHFGTGIMQILSSQCHSTTWNIALSISPKSHFRSATRQTILSYGVSKPWNIALATSRK